jgi:hypothetical protein
MFSEFFLMKFPVQSKDRNQQLKKLIGSGIDILNSEFSCTNDNKVLTYWLYFMTLTVCG